QRRRAPTKAADPHPSSAAPGLAVRARASPVARGRARRAPSSELEHVPRRYLQGAAPARRTLRAQQPHLPRQFRLTTSAIRKPLLLNQLLSCPPPPRIIVTLPEVGSAED